MCASLKPFSTSQGEIFKVNSLLQKQLRVAAKVMQFFFHSPPPSVTRFLLSLHNQFDSLSGCAVCVARSFRDVHDLHTYSMQAIAWSIGAC